MDNLIRLNLKPTGSEIERAGQQSSEFLKSHGFSNDTVDNHLMILSELIKSGIRYGNLTPSENEIIVKIFITDEAITFEVKNRVDDTCIERLKELDKTIQFIRGYQDPFEPYLIKQREADQNPALNDTSGLALAKVAYEGGAILDFFVSDDNYMNLYAVRNLA